MTCGLCKSAVFGCDSWTAEARQGDGDTGLGVAGSTARTEVSFSDEAVGATARSMAMRVRMRCTRS